ncbi:MAG: ParA family protein [Burkholderiales bacterium]|nr:ParA family protein [Burkholderiales bacterium]
MPVIVVANPKGGVGKSTLSSNIAGHLAQQGQHVLLGDIDRQQSSRLWLQLRPDHLPKIESWDVDEKFHAKPPKGVTHVVLDTPAGLHGKALDAVMKIADQIVIPLQASVFDIYATRDFVADLHRRRRSDKVKLAVVGNRIKEHTLATEHLKEFLATMDVPVLTLLRDTQNYAHLAAHGLTLFDVAPHKVEKDLEQWAPLLAWLKN